jgi:hypothetical protein
VTHRQALAGFIARATAQGVRVWAVVGDPRVIFPRERRKFVQRARAYARYNQSVCPEARLAGIQYDIEPYLLPGYSLGPEAWAKAYLATLWELKHAAPLPLEAVLPFWFAHQRLQGKSLLDRLASCVDSLVVMDYRTDPAQIQQFAEPFLAWGARHGRPVRVALETGPIADEVRRHYRPDRTGGELWFGWERGRYLLTLLKHPRRNPRGTSFRYTHTSPFPGATLTFRGREPEMMAQMARLEEQLGAWRSFTGWALHGMDAEE